MTPTKFWVLVSAVTFAMAGSLAVRAQESANDAPRYIDGNRLIRPTDYREWVFLGSSLGLTYLPAGNSSAAPSFGNVFVNPSSWRRFAETGVWPNGTVFILEVRRSDNATDPVKGGRYQSDLAALEANVKDSRFPDGWAFFTWGPARALKDDAAPVPADQAIPGEGTCVECHTKHTAVERMFGQFYPTVLEIARKKGTLKPGF